MSDDTNLATQKERATIGTPRGDTDYHTWDESHHTWYEGYKTWAEKNRMHQSDTTQVGVEKESM